MSWEAAIVVLFVVQVALFLFAPPRRTRPRIYGVSWVKPGTLDMTAGTNSMRVGFYTSREPQSPTQALCAISDQHGGSPTDYIITSMWSTP